MARDPRWTVVLGGLLLVVAVVDAALVGPSHHLVPWVRTTLLVLALPIAIAGGLMTLRDLSPPPRSRRRRGSGRKAEAAVGDLLDQPVDE